MVAHAHCPSTKGAETEKSQPSILELHETAERKQVIIQELKHKIHQEHKRQTEKITK